MKRGRRDKMVKESAVEGKRFSVCRHQLNDLGRMHGGELVKLIDEVAAFAAARHAGNVCVTASFDNMIFKAPIALNETVVIFAAVNCAWTTSLEVGAKAFVEKQDGMCHVASAYFTFVALDKSMNKTTVPSLIPETQEEKRRYREANKRRRMRLKQRKP